MGVMVYWVLNQQLGEVKCTKKYGKTQRVSRGVCYHGYTTPRKLIEYLASMWAEEQEWEPKKGQQLELFPHPMDNPDNNPFLAKIANRFNCPC